MYISTASAAMSFLVSEQHAWQDRQAADHRTLCIDPRDLRCVAGPNVGGLEARLGPVEHFQRNSQVCVALENRVLQVRCMVTLFRTPVGSFEVHGL